MGLKDSRTCSCKPRKGTDSKKYASVHALMATSVLNKIGLFDET